VGSRVIQSQVWEGMVTRAGSKQTTCAVKKMRVSLRVGRPMLEHESRVLYLLRGHTGIPALLGYGRFPHFDYMAMDLLGPTVRRKVSHGQGVSLLTVLIVADQMVCRLLVLFGTVRLTET
jgi:hypothetical protein